MEEKYKKMFSRVKASPEKIQEVIAMTESRKPRRIVRNLLVTAAIMALAVLTAMGANAASGGELFTYVVSCTFNGQDSETVEYHLDSGDVVKGGLGSYVVIEGEDGKAVITYTDGDGNEVSNSIDAFSFEAKTAKAVTE